MAMQNDDWASAIKILMGGAGTTLEDWDAHVASTELVAKHSVGDWHVQQTLGVLADFQRANGVEAAAKFDTRIGDEAESHIQYWRVAAGAALARAALDHFSTGSANTAVALAKRAISHFGHTADPSPFYEQLIAELRAHYLEES